jgi:hypothetical protein
MAGIGTALAQATSQAPAQAPATTGTTPNSLPLIPTQQPTAAPGGGIKGILERVQQDDEFRRGLQVFAMQLLANKGGNLASNIGAAGLPALNAFESMKTQRENRNLQIEGINTQRSGVNESIRSNAVREGEVQRSAQALEKHREKLVTQGARELTERERSNKAGEANEGERLSLEEERVELSRKSDARTGEFQRRRLIIDKAMLDAQTDDKPDVKRRKLLTNKIFKSNPGIGKDGAWELADKLLTLQAANIAGNADVLKLGGQVWEYLVSLEEFKDEDEQKSALELAKDAGKIAKEVGPSYGVQMGPITLPELIDEIFNKTQIDPSLSVVVPGGTEEGVDGVVDPNAPVEELDPTAAVTGALGVSQQEARLVEESRAETADRQQGALGDIGTGIREFLTPSTGDMSLVDKNRLHAIAKEAGLDFEQTQIFIGKVGESRVQPRTAQIEGDQGEIVDVHVGARTPDGKVQLLDAEGNTVIEVAESVLQTLGL